MSAEKRAGNITFPGRQRNLRIMKAAFSADIRLKTNYVLRLRGSYFQAQIVSESLAKELRKESASGAVWKTFLFQFCPSLRLLNITKLTVKKKQCTRNRMIIWFLWFLVLHLKKTSVLLFSL